MRKLGLRQSAAQMLMARRHRRSGVQRKTASLDKAAARMQTPALRKLDAKVKWR